MPDTYSGDDLAFLQDQIRQAVATGLPWMIDNARQAWEYATNNGASLPFDAHGNDTGGAAQLPQVPDRVSGADAQTATAIAQAQQQGVYPRTASGGGGGESPYSVDQAIAASQAPPAPATPEAPPSLATDPAYLAFQRALGLERSTAEGNTQSQIDAVNRAAALKLPQIGEQAAISRERISGGYEDRGLLRSGQHEVALARQREGEANLTAQTQNSAAERVAALNQALAQQETGFGSREAEAALAAGQRQQDFTTQQTQASQQAASIAALLAQQQRNSDALNARYDKAIADYGVGGGPGATTATPTAASPAAAHVDPANPLSGIVGIVPDSSDPDYLSKLLAIRQRQG